MIFKNTIRAYFDKLLNNTLLSQILHMGYITMIFKNTIRAYFDKLLNNTLLLLIFIFW